MILSCISLDTAGEGPELKHFPMDSDRFFFAKIRFEVKQSLVCKYNTPEKCKQMKGKSELELVAVALQPFESSI